MDRFASTLIAAGFLHAAAAGCTAPAGAAPKSEDRPELLVFAAASLRDALAALEDGAAAACGHRLVFNFAGSGDLARQIGAGAAADLFLSADPAWVDSLDARRLVDASSRQAVCGNELVVVVPAGGEARAAAESALPWDSPRPLAAAAVRRVALAHPETVPAGRYAREWLERAGLWSAVSPKVVPALDVRAALAAVESGAAQAGVVYRTDAASSRRVRVAYAATPAESPLIRYEAVVVATSARGRGARRLLDWLVSPPAAAIFAAQGFTPPPRP